MCIDMKTSLQTPVYSFQLGNDIQFLIFQLED